MGVSLVDFVKVSKKYDLNKANFALENVSFSLREGEVMGLLGPNGSGKSTLINILVGLLSATAGQVFTFGVDPFKDKEKIKQSLGYAPQQAAIMQYMTVQELVDFFKFLYSISTNSKDFFEEFDLGHVRHKRISELSIGLRQRVSLMLALIGDPSLLVLDEPTNGLDPNARMNFWEMIKRRKKAGLTVLLSTHLLEEAQAVCDSLLVLRKGKVISDSSVEEFIAAHGLSKVLLQFNSNFNFTKLKSNQFVFKINLIEQQNHLKLEILTNNIVELLNIVFLEFFESSPKLLEIHANSLGEAYINTISGTEKEV